MYVAIPNDIYDTNGWSFDSGTLRDEAWASQFLQDLEGPGPLK